MDAGADIEVLQALGMGAVSWEEECFTTYDDDCCATRSYVQQPREQRRRRVGLDGGKRER